jgi:cob(I)alamin adenosyltransferase
MLLIYTGNGKGKTSACVGQTLRALGQDMHVAFGQFMKKDGQAGEQRMLSRLLGDGFRAGGKGFLRKEEDRPAHREAALAMFDWGMRQLEDVDMLVLDETLYALGCGILEETEVRALVDKARARGVHLVLSGRGLPEWLAAEADLITEMGEVKHPWQQGVTATKGIEY